MRRTLLVTFPEQGRGRWVQGHVQKGFKRKYVVRLLVAGGKAQEAEEAGVRGNCLSSYLGQCVASVLGHFKTVPGITASLRRVTGKEVRCVWLPRVMQLMIQPRASWGSPGAPQMLGPAGPQSNPTQAWKEHPAVVRRGTNRHHEATGGNGTVPGEGGSLARRESPGRSQPEQLGR